MANSRFRRLTELFVQGKPVLMPDESYLWVQVINAFEREECLSDAQVARARLILALKETGSERVKVQARYAELGHESMARDLAQGRAGGKLTDYADELRDDPEWKERMEIALRTDVDELAMPVTPQETAVLAKINEEVLNELSRRESEEAEFLQRKYARMDESEFIDEWVEEWIERKGSNLATAEYRLTELWYATRYCVAMPDQDGQLDHSRCDGHRERFFETKIDARSAPTPLQELLREALDSIGMVGSDPKDSASVPSSSESSPTPSAPEESTPSTTTAPLTTAPGSSSTPSLTPSPS